MASPTAVAPPAELVLCKIEEWDHLTGHVRYGTGYPDVPLWHEIPFFDGQNKIVLRNCGLINPDDIEEYIAVGGYQALYKVLIDQNPAGVIEQIKAAKLRGRGGAGYLTGNKWEFLQKAQGPDKYLICNADEGDPGAYMNRNEIESRPARAARGHAHRRLRHGRLRGHHLRARRVPHRRAAPGARHRAGACLRRARQEHPGPRLRLRHPDRGGRRRLRLRRGDGPHRLARRHRAGRPRPRPPFPAQKGL